VADAKGDSPVAVVTGGAGFIGSAVVQALQSTGHRAVALDREGPYGLNLGDEAQVRQVAKQVLADFGRCDVIVHAGVAFERSDLAGLDVDLWRRVMAVNVESVLWLMQELTPGMSQRGFGRVILLVSNTFFSPPAAPGMLPYIASKGALVGVARTLSRTFGPDGITINCVAPGMTPPPPPNPGMGPELIADVVRRQAIPRSLVPDDVAGVVAFLASAASQGMTGQTLCPDGGLALL
jgi:pyridoxal 4-dehydrogenase